MAKLSYAAIIERDQRARALAELGLRLDLAELPQLMPRLVDLVAPEHLPLLAESRSILGADGYWLAESHCDGAVHQGAKQPGRCGDVD